MRLLEWYLGLSPAAPGQGTEWGLSGEPPWSGAMPEWVSGLLLIGVITGVVAVYLKDARSLSWPVRIGLILLRLATLALLLVMLCRLTITVTRTGLPTLAVLIDTSASMGLEDRYPDPAAARSARRLAPSVEGDSAGRLTIAQSLLTEDNGRFLRQLAKTHRLKLYQFSDSATVVHGPPSEPSGDDLQPLIDSVRALRPTGKQTRPALAVRHVLDDLRGSPPTALIVLTDGITTTGPDDHLTVAANDARDRSVPLVLIGIGSDEPAKDVQLENLLADDVVFVDDPITFAFQLKAFGYDDASVRVTLRRPAVPGVLQTIDVAMEPDGQSVAAELTHTPDQEGQVEYIIEAEPLSGESSVANNTVTHRVHIRREELRVLLVERLPRWEFRHLKPLLERDPTVQLRTVLQQADISFSDEDRTALPRVPMNREALFNYDVIIWGDVDLTSLPPGALEHLQEFVAERGGGLILVAGEWHNPRSYRDTVLEDLLPVSIADAEGESLAWTAFRPELTREGRTHSALRLTDSGDENTRLWGSMAPLYWLHASGRRKPAAQVLAIHPSRHGEGGPLPVIVLQRFGAGQVLFHATDELWQWRRRLEDRYYGRYWLQMIRYLSRSKLRSDARGIELATDRSVYQQGDSVELRARFLDPRTTPLAPEAVRAVIEGPGGYREDVRLSRQPEAPSLFSGRLSGLAAGSYHAWLAEPGLPATEPNEDRAAPAEVPSTDFRVEISASEVRDRVFQRAELIEAAKRSRGTYYPFWEASGLLDGLPRGRAVPVSSEMLFPLWNRWEVLSLLTILLTTEWISRKRAGLI